MAKKLLKTDRKQELIDCFNGIESETRKIIEPLVDDVVFLEEILTNLRKLPFIRINPKNNADQKQTMAAKQYKEFLQQYNNCIKILTSVLRKDTPEQESVIMQFLNSRRGNDE